MRVLFIKPLAREDSINVNCDYITNQTMSTFLVQATITSSLNYCSGLLTGVPTCTRVDSPHSSLKNIFWRETRSCHFLTQSPVSASHHMLNKLWSPYLPGLTRPYVIWLWPISLIFSLISFVPHFYLVIISLRFLDHASMLQLRNFLYVDLSHWNAPNLR